MLLLKRILNLSTTLFSIEPKIVDQHKNYVYSVKEIKGDIAHLVERFHGMEEAWGSNPHISTKNNLKPTTDKQKQKKT